jgi:hypothetical protein
MLLLKLKRRCTLRLLSVIGATPILLWSLILLIAPTDWARARLVHKLEESTGRLVSIDSIHLGVLGNLRIKGIAVSNSPDMDDPWLRVAEARLDISLLDVLCHRCRPKEMVVDGLDLRVHRRADGSLEFADLISSRHSEPGHSTTPGGTSNVRPEVKLTIRGSRVVIVDEPSETRVELTNTEGTATCDGQIARIELLHGQVNGGTFNFAAIYDRSAPVPAFQAEARVHDVVLGHGIKSIGLFVPVVSDVADSVDGRVDLNLALRGRGSTFEAIKPGLKGHGAIRIVPVDLTSSKLLDAIDRHRPLPRSGRLGSVESHFAIESGRVATDDLTLTIAHLPITLGGWTDFDGRIEYAFKPDALRSKLSSKLPPEARQLLGEIKDELGELADLRIIGTVDAPKLVSGLNDPAGNGQSRDVEKGRLQQAARKLKQKYLR